MTIASPPRVGINGHLLSAAQSYRSAGVSGYIRQLLLTLPDIGADLHFIAFVPNQEFPDLNGLHLRRSRRWNTQQPLQRILWEQAMLPLVAQRMGLDLLHAPVNVAPALVGCATVVTVPDLSFLRYPEAFHPLKRLYLRTQTRRSLRAARRVIAISHATKRDIEDLLGIPGQRVEVIHLGVDPAFCPAPADQVADWRRRLGLPERYLFYLGTLEPRKNLVTLVQAFQQLLRRAEQPGDLKLVLAGGKGWYYDSIFQEVSRLGLEQDVIFPGYVPDQQLPWWYRAAEAFAYPSLMEGFGLPVAEALACGTPTVTSNVSSLPEVAGQAALLVDPTSVEALAEALVCLIGDPDLSLSLRHEGPRQASRFSWQRTARETAATYRKALGQAGGES